MPITSIAIDDEPLALALISEYAARIPELSLVQTFEDAISGAEYLRQYPVDVLFIDINMPDITGIDLVRSLEKKPLTIFTTAYKQFACEGFELEAIDYLLKPIAFDRFSKAVQRAGSLKAFRYPAHPATGQHFFVRSEYRMIRIECAQVQYIEGLEDYVKIHIDNEKPVLTLMTMKAIMEKLPAGLFRRIHRSYIIPLRRVKAIHNRKLLLDRGRELPISDSYLGFIQEWTQQKPL
ncbi:LytR/AlgR family response regulator transcription factor [Sediminibacterium soli]|uniref:LytR/AlgR family response regulator transcription factor n=1 Tax=Sediminibacterium soli TaxID=2698829 RepID=UPI0013795F2F|nr:response regulator transcription factor [Sediminibacterium soli]NCI48263.1 response regulator transcription factor [Sediminibacterium soli]